MFCATILDSPYMAYAADPTPSVKLGKLKTCVTILPILHLGLSYTKLALKSLKTSYTMYR
jgi:hypothetical protein